MDVRTALGAAVSRLAKAGVPEPRADAEVLLAQALGTDRAGLVVRSRDPLPHDASAVFEALLVRRTGREPVSYLTGEDEFWSLPVHVDRRVLIPRPETELLVETAVAVAPSARRVLDAGTGSGALAAALARELPAATVWASDRERAALEVARDNLARLAPAVGLVRADWLAAFRSEAFDLVVANPPYVRTMELPDLEPEVREHEPRSALVAGEDGLDAVRSLVAQAPRVVAPGGWILLEIGRGQATAVLHEFAVRDVFCRTVVRRDAAGIERVVGAQRTATGGGQQA